VVVAGALFIVTLLYFALLASAIVTNGGLGGPLALPGMMIMTFAGAVISALVFFATTSAAELLRRRAGMSRFMEIPIATLFVGAALTFAFARLDFGVATVIAAVELLLLGVYWWTLQAAELLLAPFARLYSPLVPQSWR
jgi:hypothetical protein